MKLTCSQTELNAAVALVGRAVAARPTHPILANVLLTADAATGQLRLTGFDLNLGMQTTIPASIETSGATTVPARLFGEIISRLPNDAAITLAADEQLEITTTSGSYRVAMQPAEDFPGLPTADAQPLQLPAADLIRGLKATLFASSSDESKQLLTGVHLSIGGATAFAATDGHRLAVLKLGASGGGADTELTVPARSLREMERLLAATGADAVSIAAASGQIVFRCGDRLLVSRSLDGTYPNYGQLIPATFSRSITVNRKALQGALERVAVLADQHNNVVKLKADPGGELLVTADAQDVGSGAEQLAAEVTGDAMTIAFNVRYVLDGLKAMSTEEVTISANSETTPVVIAGDPGYTYLVMPVQVRS